MDVYGDTFLDLWRVLNKTEVKSILIGEFAMYFHGHKHFSGDIDLFIDDSITNMQKLRSALYELGMNKNASIEQIQFDNEWVDFTLKNNVRLDITTSLKGVHISFDECLKMAPIAEIEGVEVPFLHINHLIQNKKIVNRPKDQLDIIELEKIRKIMEEKNRQP